MRQVRSWIRHAWATARRSLVRLVLASVGSKQGLPQLCARHTIERTRRGTRGRWSPTPVRYMEDGAMLAGEGKRVLAADDGYIGDDEDEQDIDVWYAVILEADEELAAWLVDDVLSLTWHGHEHLIQAIFEEPLGKRIIGSEARVKLMTDAARLLHEDYEVHITWPQWQPSSVG